MYCKIISTYILKCVLTWLAGVAFEGTGATDATGGVATLVCVAWIGAVCVIEFTTILVAADETMVCDCCCFLR